MKTLAPKCFLRVLDKFFAEFVLHDPELGAGATLLYLNLFRLSGQRDHCWPSQATLAEACKCSEGAQSSQGRMEALQSANQLASHQANQLLQLRALLTAQIAAENARSQTVAAREARQQAADEKAVESRYQKSPGRVWKP